MRWSRNVCKVNHAKTCLCYDQVTWTSLSRATKSFRELYSHSTCLHLVMSPLIPQIWSAVTLICYGHKSAAWWRGLRHVWLLTTPTMESWVESCPRSGYVFSFCVVLSCIKYRSCSRLIPHLRSPTKMSKKSFIASEINSELEKTTGPNVCDNLRWSEVEIM